MLIFEAVIEDGATGSAKAEPHWLGTGALLCAGAYWFYEAVIFDGTDAHLKVGLHYGSWELLLVPGPVGFFKLTLLDAVLIFGRLSSAGRALDL